MSPRPSASSSDGEILDSGSDKATISNNLKNSLIINHPSRKRGYPSSRSPSPYRASKVDRGDRLRSPRSSIASYDARDLASDYRTPHRHYSDHHRQKHAIYKHSKASHSTERSRRASPPRGRESRQAFVDASDVKRKGREDTITQSVRSPGLGSVSINRSQHHTETHKPQVSLVEKIETEMHNSESLQDYGNGGEQIMAGKCIDDLDLIEQRRKRREAIMAKYRPQPDLQPGTTPEQCSGDTLQPLITASTSQPEKASQMRQVITERLVTSDLDIRDSSICDPSKSTSNFQTHPDEASAADYDPTLDMQEDSARQHRLELQESKLRQVTVSEQESQTKKTSQNGQNEPLASLAPDSDGFDMFAETDMFAPAEAVFGDANPSGKTRAVALQQSSLDTRLMDEWDDGEAYYKIILGEILDRRYRVETTLGKGMFSGVVRALDQDGNRLVAIKVIRNNDIMRRAGLKEIDILQRLMQLDPEDKKHLIRFERQFDHKGHLCMVFESLSINLRDVLKKFGRDVGINLRAVRVYAQHMFLGLTLLRKAKIIHADLKPDNMLVNESRSILKICDLGSASDASDAELTPYLVSRFYRAPEVILGLPYDYAIDIWSIGCTLFELFTGKILFTGRNNNQMLRAIMECRGKMSLKALRKAQFTSLHFDEMMNFKSVESDRITGRETLRIINFLKPTRDLKSRILASAEYTDEAGVRDLNSFVDLLDRCLNISPEKRCTPAEALKHPFFARST